MLKKIAKSIALICLFSAAATQALPIVQADAFSAGDNKAAIQTSTGLTWMDFGINNHLSRQEVVDRLSTDYSGWRLPTDSEAFSFINDLMGALPEWTLGDPDYGLNYFLDVDSTSNTYHDYFAALINVLGYDLITPTYLYIDNVLVNTYDHYSLNGLFAMSTGGTGVFTLQAPIEDGQLRSSSSYFYVNTWTQPDYIVGTTLLVKDTAAQVPEPSLLALGLIALLGLLCRRKTYN